MNPPASGSVVVVPAAPARAWRVGATGEELVGARLEALVRRDDRWRILNAVPVGARGSDIDHVVVGPSGVFTISTKHHPGGNIWIAGRTFMVDGARRHYIRNSRHEAARAARLLTRACGFDVSVTPLIVLVRYGRLTIRDEPDGVVVLTRWKLSRWLRRRPEVLGGPALATVQEAARRSTTWSVA